MIIEKRYHDKRTGAPRTDLYRNGRFLTSYFGAAGPGYFAKFHESTSRKPKPKPKVVYKLAKGVPNLDPFADPLDPYATNTQAKS